MNSSTNDVIQLLLAVAVVIGVLICWFCWLNCNGVNICNCGQCHTHHPGQESDTPTTPEYVKDGYNIHTIQISPEVDTTTII